MNRIVIEEPRNLDKILDCVHDQVFEVDKIEYEEPAKILQIPFWHEDVENRTVMKNYILISKWRIPVHQWTLFVHHVTRYQIDETERVGMYDFNVIEYASSEGKICIRTGIPLSFSIWVDGFKLEVQPDESVCGFREVWGPFGTRVSRPKIGGR